MMTADGYAIGGKQSNTALRGIADTGTTLLMVDTSVVTAYYKQVKGAKNDQQQGGYTFPCTATLPDFSLIIEGETRTGMFEKYWRLSARSLNHCSSRQLHQLRPD